MKSYIKNLVSLSLCLSICVCMSVNARIIPEDEKQSLATYYDTSEDYSSRMFKACDIQQNTETEEITFKEAMTLEGTQPQYSDLVYIIDNYTEISESQETLNSFTEGKLPWLMVWISNADIIRIKDEGLRTVHVAYTSFMSSDVTIYPNPEETVRNERLKNYGIMVGDENGKFNPYQALTRAELTKIAVMMSNPDFMETVDLSKQSFSDLNSEHWSYPYVEYAKQSGIIDGYDDGTFKPETDVTVIEALKIIVNLLGYSTQAEQAGGYPSGYIKTAEKLGLTNTVAVGYDKYTIRTEAADIINIALDLPLMVQTDDGEYVLCDGSNPEYPTMTLSLKNFSN